MSPPLPRSPDFTLPSSGAIPAQNTTNGQLLVMGAGFGCTGGLFILAAILYCIILCVQKRYLSGFSFCYIIIMRMRLTPFTLIHRASTSCVGAYVPQNIDEFEQALELVRRGMILKTSFCHEYILSIGVFQAVGQPPPRPAQQLSRSGSMPSSSPG